MLARTIAVTILLAINGAQWIQKPSRERVVSPQGSNEEARWEGTLNGQVEIKMGLKRKGPNLSGTVTYTYKGGFTRGTYEVEGKVDDNGSFTLTETTSVIWEGRFISPDQIMGVRFNGPANDTGAPKWPFTLKRIEILPTGSIVEPTEAGPTSGEWVIFFTAFRTAVKSRDRETLRVMMSRNFDYGNDFNVPPDKVFSELDNNDGNNWAILGKTIAKGALPYKLPTSQRPARVAKNLVPCGKRPCNYQAWVIFELDKSRQWRWKSMLFPGD